MRIVTRSGRVGNDGEPGVRRAIVTADDDPQGLGRVKFNLTGDTRVSDWAAVVVTGAPALTVGRTVIVAYESGDLSRPVILGAVTLPND